LSIRHALPLVPICAAATVYAVRGLRFRWLSFAAAAIAFVLFMFLFNIPNDEPIAQRVLLLWGSLGLGAVTLGVVLAIAPWDALDGSGSGIAPWTYGVVGLCVAATLALLLRQVRDQDRILARRCVIAVAPAVLALGALVLVQDPDCLADVRDRDEAAAPFVEELLRYLTVVQVAFPRFAREDITIGGRRILAGDMVFCSLSAANRDARQGPDMRGGRIAVPPGGVKDGL